MCMPGDRMIMASAVLVQPHINKCYGPQNRLFLRIIIEQKLNLSIVELNIQVL